MAVLTKPERLLASAVKLTLKEGKREFTAEELIVRSFLDYPNDFSLKGYAGKYPNSNSVLKHIMGRQAPVITRGWFEKVGPKRYRLTPKGHLDLQALDSSIDESSADLERRYEETLGRLMTSKAFTLYKEGRKEEITFHQFCRFAGLTARDKWQKIAGRLEMLGHDVRRAVQIGEAGQSVSAHLSRNYTFSPDELRLLGPLHGFLLERFRPAMQEWKQTANK